VITTLLIKPSLEQSHETSQNVLHLTTPSPPTHTHTHTRARTHTRTHPRTHIHTHPTTHALKQTRTHPKRGLSLRERERERARERERERAREREHSLAGLLAWQPPCRLLTDDQSNGACDLSTTRGPFHWQRLLSDSCAAPMLHSFILLAALTCRTVG